MMTRQREALEFFNSSVDRLEMKRRFNGMMSMHGPSEGFVYFMGIGHPYITHVKIGFTTDHPSRRLANLQTGCPFKITLLGFVLGNRCMEAEYHDVLADDRCEGEWFVFSDYVQTIIDGELEGHAW